jgi:hypothetical protein
LDTPSLPLLLIVFISATRRSLLYLQGKVAVAQEHRHPRHATVGWLMVTQTCRAPITYTISSANCWVTPRCHPLLVTPTCWLTAGYAIVSPAVGYTHH